MSWALDVLVAAIWFGVGWQWCSGRQATRLRRARIQGQIEGATSVANAVNDTIARGGEITQVAIGQEVPPSPEVAAEQERREA